MTGPKALPHSSVLVGSASQTEEGWCGSFSCEAGRLHRDLAGSGLSSQVFRASSLKRRQSQGSLPSPQKREQTPVALDS